MRPTYWSFAEEWEHRIEELQHLPPRCCYAAHKIQGAMIALQTAEIEPAREALSMNAEEYAAFMRSVPFGRNHLVARQELATQIEERRKALDTESQALEVKVSKVREAVAEPPK